MISSRPMDGAGEPTRRGRRLPPADSGPQPVRGRRLVEIADAPLRPPVQAVGAGRGFDDHGITPGDLRAIYTALVRRAAGGNLEAAREVLDRVLGRPVEADILRRLEAVESRLNGIEERGP